MPLDDTDAAPDTDALVQWLDGQFGASESLIDARYTSEHYKAKRKYPYGGYRIDVFIL